MGKSGLRAAWNEETLPERSGKEKEAGKLLSVVV